jgi:hypothetical protein
MWLRHHDSSRRPADRGFRRFPFQRRAVPTAVARHPRPLALLAVVVLLGLSIATLSLRLGSSDAGNVQRPDVLAGGRRVVANIERPQTGW